MGVLLQRQREFFPSFLGAVSQLGEVIRDGMFRGEPSRATLGAIWRAARLVASASASLCPTLLTLAHRLALAAWVG